MLIPVFLMIATFVVASCGGCGLLSDEDRSLMRSMDSRINSLTAELRTLNQGEGFASLGRKLERLNQGLERISETMPTNVSAQLTSLNERFAGLTDTLQELNDELSTWPLGDGGYMDNLSAAVNQIAEEMQAIHNSLDALAGDADALGEFLEEHEETFQLMHEVFEDFSEMTNGANGGRDPGGN